MPTTHQPDQDVFRSVLPEDVDWEPFAPFPPSARLAVLVGRPTEPGPYVIRVKVPSGVKLMPHRHQEDRVYTVMSGVFYIGRGDQFDEEKLEAYPPGSIVVLPGDTPHFHWAKSGEYVTQVTALGPISLTYLNPEDDPGSEPSRGSGYSSERQRALRSPKWLHEARTFRRLNRSRSRAPGDRRYRARLRRDRRIRCLPARLRRGRLSCCAPHP